MAGLPVFRNALRKADAELQTISKQLSEYVHTGKVTKVGIKYVCFVLTVQFMDTVFRNDYFRHFWL